MPVDSRNQWCFVGSQWIHLQYIGQASSTNMDISNPWIAKSVDMDLRKGYSISIATVCFCVVVCRYV